MYHNVVLLSNIYLLCDECQAIVKNGVLMPGIREIKDWELIWYSFYWRLDSVFVFLETRKFKWGNKRF